MSGIPISLSEVLQDLWQRKIMLFFFGIVACLGSIAALQVFPTRFSSEGLLLAESRALQLPELDSEAAVQSTPNNRDQTVIGVLRSRALLEDTVRSLNVTMADLDIGPQLPSPLIPYLTAMRTAFRDMLNFLRLTPSTDGERILDHQVEDLVEYLQKHIEIEMAEKSSIVSLRFTAPQPTQAAAVVNKLMQSYIGAEIAQRRDVIKRTNEWLTQRITQLRQEVEEADAKVQDYRRRKGLFHVGAGSLQAVNLGSQQNELLLARQELINTEASLSSMQNAERIGASALAAQETLASPVIQALRRREAELSQRLAMADQRIGPSNVDQAALNGELRAVRMQIATEAKSIIGALARAADIKRNLVRSLEREIAEAEGLAADSAVGEITLAGLEKYADIKRQTYSAFVAKADRIPSTDSAFASARVVSSARPPVRADSSHALVIALMAFFGGVMLAAAIRILRRRVDDKVRSIVELASVTGMPTMGSFPKVSRDIHTAALDDQRSGVAETLRAMYVSLLSKKVRNGGSVVLVTSSDVGEGKTTIATALGRRLAADGRKVLLIDADFFRPHVGTMLGLPSNKCLERVLGNKQPIDEAIQVDTKSGLHCLVAAGGSDCSMTRLASESFDEMISNARQSYQLIIIDSPPVLRVADPLLLARWSDLILFVVRSDRTSFALVREALRRLSETQDYAVVLALNCVTRRHLDLRDCYTGYSARRASPAPLLPFGR